jgi:hypothetical protein
MPEFMSEEEAVRLKQLVERSATWEPTGQVLKTSGGYRLEIKHRLTGRKRLVNNLQQWDVLAGHSPAIYRHDLRDVPGGDRKPARLKEIGEFILGGLILPSLVLLAIAGPFIWPGETAGAARDQEAFHARRIVPSHVKQAMILATFHCAITL